MSRRVPFFDYPSVFTAEEDVLLGIVRDVGRRGAFVLQQDLRDFEAHLAAYTGARFAVGVSNATDGLQMAFMAGGLQDGDEVLIASHTMIATAAAVRFAGGVPIPVDCDDEGLLDAEACAAAITERTRAICPTQLNGRIADMRAIEALARRHGLALYEDAAQALGARYHGRGAGCFGVAGVISFYPAKTLGCLGDGGAVLCDDEDLYRRLLLLRDHGRIERGECVAWGFNARLDNLQAAILDHRLAAYDRTVARRRELAARYHRQLAGIPALRLPPAPDADPERFDIYQNYELQAEHRDALQVHLAERGVGSSIQWGGWPVHRNRKLGFDQACPRTDALFERCLMPPLNLSIADEDVDYVCEQIRDFYAA